MNGVVVKWTLSGFGFIEAEALDRDAYFNTRNIETPDWEPHCGDEVEFSPREWSNGNITANSVILLKSVSGALSIPDAQVGEDAASLPIDVCPEGKNGQTTQSESPPDNLDRSSDAPPEPSGEMKADDDRAQPRHTSQVSIAASESVTLPDTPTLTSCLEALAERGRREESRLRREAESLKTEVDLQSETVETAKLRLTEAQQIHAEG